MAEHPFLPMATDAYFGDTRHLTTLEHGAYLLLLFTAWRSPDCRLPDDDRLLAKYAGLGTQQWARIRPTIAGFWDVKDGWWTQKRLSATRITVRRKTNRAKNAREAKALKNKEPDKDYRDYKNDLQAVNHNHNHNHNVLDISISNTPPSPSGGSDFDSGQPQKPKPAKPKYPPGFEDFWAVYPKKVAKEAAVKAWQKAIKLGIDPAHMIDSAKWYAEQQPPDKAYTKHPATWLNQGCYDDERIENNGKSTGASQQNSYQAPANNGLLAALNFGRTKYP